MTVYRVTAQDKLIGATSLEWQDIGMVVAFGQFSPTAGYQAVRDTFVLFTQALGDRIDQTDQQKLAEYFRARDALNLRLETEEGTPIETGHIHIVDWRDEIPDAEFEVEVQVPDPGFWAGR